jgi:hypothetical protein
MVSSAHQRRLTDRHHMRICATLFVFALALAPQSARDWDLEITQLTRGPMHHFFGYIGQARTIPWNEPGRYVVALRTTFQDRMPEPGEPADVVLIDTTRTGQVERVDQSRGWNPQQGTMFYWHPAAPATQFFFNDRDPQSQKIFTVLYDVAARKRVREFRFDETPVANSGVAQKGGPFLAINYGRLARLRPVTGYPGAFDYTAAELHPSNDGIHIVDAARATRRLLVSYKQLADLIRPARPDVDRKALFINHTLWSRDDSQIYFYVRAEFDNPKERIDIPCTIRPDGTGLAMHPHLGGHPEWESGRRMMGAEGGRQVIYDVIERRIVETLGSKEVFPQPGGDIALSPDGQWFVNGHSDAGNNYYTVLHRTDGTWARTPAISRGRYTGGDLRIDGAPAWNRTSDAILFPGLDPSDGTRQIFVINIRRKK